MKLSKSTLAILKTFANINPSIYLQKGSVIMTKSVTDIVYADAKIEDIIDADIGIYDLSEFLSIMNLFNPDEVEIECNTADMEIVIKDSRSSVNYTIHDPSLIVHPARQGKFPVCDDIVFELKKADFDRLKAAASTLGLPEIMITRDGNKIIMKAVDPKDSAKNDYSLEVAEYKGDCQFEFYLNVNNLMMPKDDYLVRTFKNKAVNFEGETSNYIITMQATSTFSEN